jgi:hypothetical protein
MHFVAVDAAAKTTVSPGDNAITTDHACKTFDPLRDQFRVFDQVDTCETTPGTSIFAIRQLDIPPDYPFVFVAGICRFAS